MKKILALVLTVMLLFALAVPAMPVEFVPSAEQKVDVEIVAITDDEGNSYEAIVELNDEIVNVADGLEVELVVTVVSSKETSPNKEIEMALEKAVEQVQEAESISELCPEIDEYMESMGYEAENFYVHDVFNAALLEVISKELVELPEDATIKFRLQTDLESDEPFVLLCNTEGDKWEIIGDVTLDENGVLTVRVKGLAPFAILRRAKTGVLPDPGTGEIPQSPQTGDSFPVLYLAGALLCAGAAAVLFRKLDREA